MMPELKQPYDVIVAGVGAMGSAACYHLARRGQRVLGLDRHGIPNNLGSSHGLSRIIRLAYYESTAYVPLLHRAFELWHELEKGSGQRLLIETGSIDASIAGGPIVEGSVRSCIEHDLEHEVLSASELHQRFPGYALPEDFFACFQKSGGFLRPELCISAHANAAMAAGADLRAHEPVLEWQVENGAVRVETKRGTYRAERLVLCAGAWMGELASVLREVAVAERQVLAWFQPHKPEQFLPACFPVFNVGVDEGNFYGLPAFDIPGFKVGRYHHLDETGHPDDLRAPPNRSDEALLRSFTERYFPAAAGSVLNLRTCMFTNTPDEHFVLDLHPDEDQVVLASPCSGHGFKFASVVGEILADLATTGETAHNIEPFRLKRLT